MIRHDSSHLHIGKNRQLFFDNQVIERTQDLTRVVHTPKAEPEPLIQADRPWEKITYFALGTHNVVRDRDGQWHCWYCNWDYDPKRFAETRDGYDLKVSFLRLCYARSADGIHWEKPLLGLHQVDGRDTNIIVGDESFGGFYIVTPIEDPFEEDPAKRFKTLGVRVSSAYYRIEAAYSADGIHWNFYETPPCFGTWGPYLQDEFTLGYDPLGRMYTATVRSPYQGATPLSEPTPLATKSFLRPVEHGAWWRGNKRRIFQTESSDLLHWSQPYPILAPDEIDNLDESFYGMCQTRIGDTHIGFVNLFRECENTLRVRLAWSRDGKNWEWANQRQPWLESAKMSGAEWDSVMVYQGVPPIEVGDEHWIYYGGAKSHHDWFMSGMLEGMDHPEAKDMSNIAYHLGLAKMRLDGFVSIQTSPHREGILVTRAFFPEGTRLVINARVATGGYLDIEVTDSQGNILPGFSREDCDTFTGDNVRHVVTWNGNPDAEFIKHMPEGIPWRGYCKLHIYLRKADLYSFQSTDDPEARCSFDPDVSRKRSVKKWE